MSSITINTGYSISPIFNCGVYVFDGSLTTNTGYKLRPVPCSITSLLSKMNFDQTIDAVILYPGFSITLYTSTEYVSEYRTIVNTYTDKILIRGVAASIRSCRVYYQGTEIILYGLSNNTRPTTIVLGTTETFTGTGSTVV